MLYPCNDETKNMSQANLTAYYEGANAALYSADNLPDRVFENPSVEIGNAFRLGHAAQLAAMANDSSII